MEEELRALLKARRALKLPPRQGRKSEIYRWIEASWVWQHPPPNEALALEQILK